MQIMLWFDYTREMKDKSQWTIFDEIPLREYAPLPPVVLSELTFFKIYVHAEAVG